MRKYLFTKEEEKQICDEYFSKEKPYISTLAKKWCCDSTTIRNVIIRNGYSLRTRSEVIKGQKRSEETKQKIRRKIIQHYQTHPGPFKDTKPELKMKEILDSLGILFEHQFRVRNCLFDFYILNTNILIEVDGDYWHGNPAKFSSLNKMQKEMKQRDIKHNKIAFDNGFILLRFWENDILKKDDIVRNKIYKRLKNLS
ncbi:MAG: DUF559 domain-containing protein [Candidatus Cloacimonetes bacterium]|nr:DUF559 domain-containing protein [Candidatus Cloacimonadota bacterium]